MIFTLSNIITCLILMLSRYITHYLSSWKSTTDSWNTHTYSLKVSVPGSLSLPLTQFLSNLGYSIIHVDDLPNSLASQILDLYSSNFLVLHPTLSTNPHSHTIDLTITEKKKKKPTISSSSIPLFTQFQVSHFSTTTFFLTNFLSFSCSNDTSTSLIESTTPTLLQVLISLPTAAAAAKLLQSCPTLWDHRDGSPPGSPIPGIL